MIMDPARSNLVAMMPRSIELINPRGVGDVYGQGVRAHMGRNGDSVCGSRRGCGAHPYQYKRWDDFAASRSGNGLAAMPAYRLSGPRGPIP